MLSESNYLGFYFKYKVGVATQILQLIILTFQEKFKILLTKKLDSTKIRTF